MVDSHYAPPGTEWLGEPDADNYPQPKDGWVCFHCGLRCLTHKAAKTHFGPSPTSLPGCVIRSQQEQGLLVALRIAEIECARLKAQLDNQEIIP